MRNNVGLLLAKRAFLNPGREAYVDTDSGLRLTFAELNARSNRLARALIEDGVRPGERVALLLMNSVEFMEAYFALAKIGGVMVPLNWRLVAEELEFILKDCGAVRLIFGAEFLDTVMVLQSRGDRTEVQHWLQVGRSEEPSSFAVSYESFCERGAEADVEPRAGEEDALYIMYTSGTTGLPKGVVHTHGTALWGILTISATADFREGDRYLAPLPMFHVGTLTPVAVNVYRGVATVLMRTFDPVLAWQLIEQERITTGVMVPAMLNFMLQVEGFDRFDRSSLRWMMTGAAPVPVPLLEKYADLGIGILQAYGLTESCGPACLLDAENALSKPGSAGKAFFHTDVKVVTESGETCAPGEPGEIVIRSRHNMREYWNRPDDTAATIRDGWLHTGDVAVMDQEGFVYIQDRLKDMIISGGENIYPAEIEGVLLAHPGIMDVAVIGLSSEKWGESPLAIVVRTDARLDAADVLSYSRTRLAGYKCPSVVEFVDEIPRNPSGKILKRLLRERYPGPAPV